MDPTPLYPLERLLSWRSESVDEASVDLILRIEIAVDRHFELEA